MARMMKHDIRLISIGDETGLPEQVREELRFTIQQTARNEGMILNLALNYSGHQEIIQATKKIALDLQKGKIRGIIEIEEADIKPTQVCGKFLTAALSNYYIHKKDGGKVEMANSVFFIQILDSSKLKDRSAKPEQFRNLGESIQGIIPLKDSRSNHYKRFTGKQDDQFDDLITFITTELGY